MKSQENPKFVRKKRKRGLLKKIQSKKRKKLSRQKTFLFCESLYNFLPKTFYLAEAKLQATVKVILWCIQVTVT